jgi:thioredoxin reductase
MKCRDLKVSNGCMVGAFTTAPIALVSSIGAVYGEGDKGARLALMMKQWSSDVLLCTDGPSTVSASMQARLQQHGITVCSDTIVRLEGTDDGALQKIHLQNGKALKRAAIFFTTGCRRQLFRSHGKLDWLTFAHRYTRRLEQ